MDDLRENILRETTLFGINRKYPDVKTLHIGQICFAKKSYNLKNKWSSFYNRVAHNEKDYCPGTFYRHLI